MKECPGCALENDDAAEDCVYCGYEFPVQRRSRVWMAWLLAALLILPIIQVLLSFLGITDSPFEFLRLDRLFSH